jgi:hypothetical protein
MDLKKLMEKKRMSLQQHPHGISIKNISEIVDKDNSNSESDPYRRVLVIPYGIIDTNVTYLKEMYGVTIADGIDDTYVSNDASFSKFISTLNTLKQTLIVAG